MKKMQKMIAVLFSVAMCAAMAVPAFAAETDTARNEAQETVMPRAIVYMSCSHLAEREAWTLQQLRFIHCMPDR